MAKHTKLDYFFNEFPNRSFQMGICEQNAISVAAGIASEGKIVVVSSFASFIVGRAWEQIRHSIAYNDNHVIIIGTHSGLSSAYDGGTHQCLEDIALTTCIPNMTVFSPICCDEATQMIEFAINNPGSYYIRIGRDIVKYNFKYDFEVGRPLLLSDTINCKTAIISTGEIGNEVLDAYNFLLEKNVKIKVIHIPTIKPLHEGELIKMLEGINNILVIEEHSQYGGLTSIISHLLIKNKKIYINNFKALNLTSFGETGSYKELKKIYNLNSEAIIKEVLNMEEIRNEFS